MNTKTIKKIYASPEVQKYIAGTKKIRLHLYADEKADAKIRKESEKVGISIADLIMCYVFSFDVDKIPDGINSALNKTNKLLKNENISVRYKKKVKERGREAMAKTTNKANTKQFHLRVTEECFEEIKRKAAEYSMSVSDYVVFVITHYDITETTDKVDEINAKLDVLLKKGENNEI